MSDLDQNKLIDKYERLFAEDGWKEIVAEMQDRRTQLKELLLVDLKTNKRTLCMAQGAAQVYDFIINLESTVEAVKQSQKDAQDLPELDNGDE